jgi:hypothetical protein
VKHVIVKNYEIFCRCFVWRTWCGGWDLNPRIPGVIILRKVKVDATDAIDAADATMAAQLLHQLQTVWRTRHVICQPYYLELGD